MGLFGVFALVGGSMLLRDTAGSMATAFIAHGRGWLAGGCDVVSDLGSLFSIGGGAVLALHSPANAIAVVAGVAAGSLLGTRAGVAGEAFVERRHRP